MDCARCHRDLPPAELYDGDLCRDCSIETHLDALADLGVGRRRPLDPSPRLAAELVETFEQRDARLALRPGGRRATRTPWSPSEVSKRLDRAVKVLGQFGLSQPRECPVCQRLFRGGRSDRITCPDGNHCRDLVRRVRHDDPTAEAAIRMLFAPPDCLGCGLPLWGHRPDARHHGPTCRKRAQRARLKQAA